MKNPDYALGHSDRELERLSAQARMIGPITKHFFREAGIREGMRVLDVGSGAGDVAFLAAELVGEGGEVVGTDRVDRAIVAATERAKAGGFHNVTFREGDPAEMAFNRAFDAVVGRYVLLFQADPAVMVRGLSKRLRPGGVIVFHEPQWDWAKSIPPASTYDRCCQWINDAFRLVGTPDLNFAARLCHAFVGAGLPTPSMRMQTYIGGGKGCAEWLQAVADLVIGLLPSLERQGVTTAADVGEATLVERMRREVESNGSVIIGRSEFAIWSRTAS